MQNRGIIMRGITASALAICLLSACGLGPAASPTLSAVSDAGILPGSKGDIRPNSKGTRLELAQLEVELQLPLSEGFQLAQVQTPASWSAELDGLAPARLRLIRSRRLANAQSLVYVLDASRPLADAELHELLFFTPDGVLQAAGLVRDLQAPEALSSGTLASWLVARELVQAEPVQTLTREALATVQAEPETVALAEDLDRLYRQSRGKADPRKSEKAKQRAWAAASKLADKVQKHKANKPNSDGPNGNPFGKVNQQD